MSKRNAILLATILGSSIVFLDATIVNVALKTIGEQVPATFFGQLEGQTYVASAYFTVLAALLILAGALNDYYGRRFMFRVGLAGFGVASVACGLAPTMELLIVARVLQAVFGALLVPGSLSIITASFEGEERGRAIGLWAAGTSAMTIIGPLLGGILVQGVSWRAAFLINAPLVLVGLWATTRMPESRDSEARAEFDWLGSIVIAIAIGGLAFGATRGYDREWADPAAWVALIAGIVATAAVPVLMLTRRRPLVPPALFASRNFTVVNVSTFVIYGALYVSMTFQALFLQGGLGYTPLAAGAIELPIAAMLTVLSTPAGQLSARLGPRVFMTAGPLIMAAGLLWLARIPADSPAWRADLGNPASLIPPGAALLDVGLGITVFGFGLSILVAPLTTALMSSVPVRNAGLGSAINNAVSRAGSPLVFAVIFIAIVGSYYPTLGAMAPDLDLEDGAVRAAVRPFAIAEDELDADVVRAASEAEAGAFHLSMAVSAALLVAGAAINAVGIRNPPPGVLAARADPTLVPG